MNIPTQGSVIIFGDAVVRDVVSFTAQSDGNYALKVLGDVTLTSGVYKDMYMLLSNSTYKKYSVKVLDCVALLPGTNDIVHTQIVLSKEPL